MTNDTLLKYREYCKNHFTNQNCSPLTDNAWTQVTYRTLNTACKKLWPDSVAERYFEGFKPDDRALIDEVVLMGESMGLKVESEDIHELLKSHKIELNTQSSYPSPSLPPLPST